MTEVIDPPTISTMTQEEIESLVLGIRERRARIVRVRSMAHHHSRDSRTTGDTSVKLERLAKKLDKALEEIDKRLSKAETLVNEVVALRIETGDVSVSELAEELAA